MTKEELISSLSDAVDRGAKRYEIIELIDRYKFHNFAPQNFKEVVKALACNITGIEVADFNGPSSKRDYTTARMMFCHVLRNQHAAGKRKYSDTEIGHEIGRDRSTAIYAYNKGIDKLGFDTVYTVLYNKLIEEIDKHYNDDNRQRV